MKRNHLRCVLAGILGFVMVSTLAAVDDKFDYRKVDAKTGVEKVVSITGQVLSEDVNGIKIKSATGKDEVFIPVAALVKASYEMPGAVRLDYGKIAGMEEKRDYAKALEDYKTLPARMATGSDQSKRFVLYRIAMLKATIEEPDAADALAAYLKAHPNSWQYSAVAKQLASIQLNKGQYDEAGKTIDALARTPNLSTELKQEAELMLIDIQFQAGKYPEVAAKIKGALSGLKPDDPQRPRMEVYQIGCDSKDAAIEETVKKLEGIIGKTEDRGLKALAYNTLGDCYSLKGLKHEAKFAYLWVDSVYNQDRSEHVKALERLAKLFDADPLKDEARAQFFRDKAARAR